MKLVSRSSELLLKFVNDGAIWYRPKFLQRIPFLWGCIFARPAVEA